MTAPTKSATASQRDDIDPDRRDDFADREKRLEQQRDLEEAVNSLLAARCRRFTLRQVHAGSVSNDSCTETLPSSASAGRIG